MGKSQSLSWSPSRILWQWGPACKPPPREDTCGPSILGRTEGNNQASVLLCCGTAIGTPAEVPGCAVLGTSPVKSLGHS